MIQIELYAQPIKSTDELKKELERIADALNIEYKIRTISDWKIIIRENIDSIPCVRINEEALCLNNEISRDVFLSKFEKLMVIQKELEYKL